MKGWNKKVETMTILKRIILDGYVVIAIQQGMDIDGSKTDPDAQMYVIPDNCIKLYYNDTIRYLTIWKRGTTGYRLLVDHFIKQLNNVQD